MAGLIKLEKEFLNKAAYVALKDKAPREELRVIEVFETPMNADASGGGLGVFLSESAGPSGPRPARAGGGPAAAGDDHVLHQQRRRGVALLHPVQQ